MRWITLPLSVTRVSGATDRRTREIVPWQEVTSKRVDQPLGNKAQRSPDNRKPKTRVLAWPPLKKVVIKPLWEKAELLSDIKLPSQVIIVKRLSLQAKNNKDSLHPDKAKLFVTWHTIHFTLVFRSGFELIHTWLRQTKKNGPTANDGTSAEGDKNQPGIFWG
jgi:hypothetical protein